MALDAWVYRLAAGKRNEVDNIKNKDTSHGAISDNNNLVVVHELVARAARRRARFARACGVLTILIITLGISYISSAILFGFDYRYVQELFSEPGESADLPRKVAPPIRQLKRDDFRFVELPDGRSIDPGIPKLIDEIAKDNHTSRDKLVDYFFKKETISKEPRPPISEDTIIRVAAIMLVVFMTQILVTFAKFFFRESGRWYSYADAIMLSKGDPDLITKVSLDLRDLDFGRVPPSPFGAVIASAKDSLSSIKEATTKNSQEKPDGKPK